MQDDLGFTALMNACASGHTATANLLIERGAEVEYHNKVRLLVQCIVCAWSLCVHGIDRMVCSVYNNTSYRVCVAFARRVLVALSLESSTYS